MPCAGTVVVAAAAGGFYAGRATAPVGEDRGCVEAKQALQTNMGVVDAHIAQTRQGYQGNPVAAQAAYQNAPNIILQNPDCFSAGDRVAAQTTKDQAALNQQSQDMWQLRRSVCEAADKSWWNC
ncbi:hypothetical protein ACWCXB_17480 [Streptomyces sp. NPDC001514]